MTNQDRSVTIDPARVVRLLGLVALFLVLASVTGQLVRFLTGHDFVYGLVPLFNLNEEKNVPTFFSACLLLLSSLLLAAIAVLARKHRAAYGTHWAILSLIFLFLAFDEATGVHELLIKPLQALLGPHASGVLKYPWVILGIVGTGVFALCYLRFWLHLPRETRAGLLCAGFVFVAGALGVEMLGAYHIPNMAARVWPTT